MPARTRLPKRPEFSSRMGGISGARYGRTATNADGRTGSCANSKAKQQKQPLPTVTARQQFLSHDQREWSVVSRTTFMDARPLAGSPAVAMAGKYCLPKLPGR